MLNNNIKKFWIEKINELKHRKGVASNLLTANENNLDDAVWQKKINDLEKWEEIEDLAYDICQDIYDKATVVDANDVFPDNISDLLGKLAANQAGKSADSEYWNKLWKTLNAFEDFVLKNYNKTAVDNLANRENQIKNALNRAPADAIPNNWDNDVKPLFHFLVNTLGVDPDATLPTIPAGENLTTLLARPTQTELDNANEWIDDLEKGFKEILEMAPTDALPNNLNDLANLYKNQSGTQTIKQLKTKADKTDTLQAWKDTHNCLANHTCPDCNLTKHNDYDTLKQEHDQLKTEQATQEQAKQQAIQAKETEIITKIITDLSLSTERERERESLLEAVITEIKTKITPPIDTTAKDNKITELEAKITSLQAPKSLNDVKVSSEVKKEITKLSQDLGISNQTFTEELKSVDSYQQLTNLQNKVFKEELSKETDSKNSAITLNYCLGALSIGSLLILAYLLIKKPTFTPEIGDKKDKE